MESAQKHEPTAYKTLCDKLRTLAQSEGRNMSEAEIHKSARNLMGYVELVNLPNRCVTSGSYGVKPSSYQLEQIVPDCLIYYRFD